MFKYKWTAYIGRFQFAHNGHYEMLKRALNLGENVIVVVGSAFGFKSPKNPFSFEQVVNSLRSYLTQKEAKRVTFIAQPDVWDEDLWVSCVKKKIKDITPLSKCALISHIKDDSGYYQEMFPEMPLEEQPSFYEGLSASTLRDIVFSTDFDVSTKVSQIAPFVGKKALKLYEKWLNSPEALDLEKEFKYYQDYQKPYAALPFAPVFSTSDTVITCVHKGVRKVLLIVRGRLPGKGCFAFPGGFLDPKDSFKKASLRELDEETGLKFSDKELKKIYKKREIFDNPLRSLRGRVVTVAHFYDLGDVLELPNVVGQDDAVSSMWMSLEECVENRDKFFEDHFGAIFRVFFSKFVAIPF